MYCNRNTPYPQILPSTHFRWVVNHLKLTIYFCIIVLIKITVKREVASLQLLAKCLQLSTFLIVQIETIIWHIYE